MHSYSGLLCSRGKFKTQTARPTWINPTNTKLKERIIAEYIWYRWYLTYGLTYNFSTLQWCKSDKHSLLARLSYDVQLKNEFSTYGIFNLKWVYQVVTPS